MDFKSCKMLSDRTNYIAILHNGIVSFWFLGYRSTVLPATSDSGVMFFYKIIRDLESIDRLCINPIHRIGIIHK